MADREHDALERQNDPPGTVGGTLDEMKALAREEQTIHEAVLRALGLPIDGDEDESDYDEDISDLHDYDHLLEAKP